MSKKEHIFTFAAAFGIIRDAVKQVTDCKSTSTDKIIFNSLNKTIAKKANKKEMK